MRGQFVKQDNCDDVILPYSILVIIVIIYLKWVVAIFYQY